MSDTSTLYTQPVNYTMFTLSDFELYARNKVSDTSTSERCDAQLSNKRSVPGSRGRIDGFAWFENKEVISNFIGVVSNPVL